MSPDAILNTVLRDALKASTGYNSESQGIFKFRAPSGTPLPYTTFVFEPLMPVPAMRTTNGWQAKVQMKHWGKDAAGSSGALVAQRLANIAAQTFHARDDAAYGTVCGDVLAALNSITSLAGWQFNNAEIVTLIDAYPDTIGDTEVWCTGHKFEFWLEFAG